MAVIFDIEHLQEFKNAVITIGTFDGVHKGHKSIIKEVVNHAKKIDGESILLTFEPHPRKLLHPSQPIGILTPLYEKLILITNAGIDHIVIIPFTPIFAHQTAIAYIDDFLVQKFHPHSIIIGYDHRFGHDRLGNIDLLRQYAQQFKYQLLETPPQLIDEAVVSSTKIRNAIKVGQVEEAAKMLGRYYSIKGTVIHGNQLGRTIGYPTANLLPQEPDQIIPATGIYAVQVTHDSLIYNGMLNIGYNPTVSNKNELRIEVNLFGFDKMIYGEILELHFIKKIREEEKFSSIDTLKQQLHLDKINAENILIDISTLNID